MQPQANYDFIFQDQKKPKRKLIGGGSSKKSRVIIVAIGGLLLLILVIIMFSILSSSGKKGTETLISLAEEQTELVRVAGIGVTKSRDGTARNLAITIQLSLETSQQQTISLLKKGGHKLGTKQLVLKKNPKTDAILDAAALNNTFDDTFIKTISEQLATYRTNVKKAYTSSKSKSEKQILADSYNGVNILLSNRPAQSK